MSQPRTGSTPFSVRQDVEEFESDLGSQMSKPQVGFELAIRTHEFAGGSCLWLRNLHAPIFRSSASEADPRQHDLYLSGPVAPRRKTSKANMSPYNPPSRNCGSIVS
jgi:hypothetical protein